jgi:glycine cleavage system protein P-like pyridoxal-binding family
MEDFEKKALELATHKPTCWFIYVDDTFVIWPCGQEKLAEILNHISRLRHYYSSQWKKKKDTFHSWTLMSTEKRTAP